MIAQGKAVSHEAAMMEYAGTKRDAEYIGSHGLLSDPVLMVEFSAQEILDEFRQHRLRFPKTTCGRELENCLLRFELCPTAEETKGWTRDDWLHFARESLRTIDSIEYVYTKSGKRKTPRTNLVNAQWLAILHHDGANGCDHLHLLVNRVDLDGHTISDKYLLAKAELAANIINSRRGWTQSMDIARQHRAELKEVCLSILREMPEWDWNDYFSRLEAKGHECFRRFDSYGQQRGYSISYGNSTIPASEIDRGLTWGKIEGTWRDLHPVPARQEAAPSASRPAVSSPGFVWYEFPNSNGRNTKLCIPKRIEDYIRSEVVLPDSSDYEDEEVEFKAPVLDTIVKVGVALFLGYIDAATTIAESHGGGGSDTSGWGRDKNEDEEEWARRCARMASRLCTPPHHPKIRRSSGWHR